MIGYNSDTSLSVSCNCVCLCCMCICTLDHEYDASMSVCAGRWEAIPRAYPEALCRSAPHLRPWPNALAILCACRRPAAVSAAAHRRTLSCPGHSALPAPGAQSVDQSAAPGFDWVAVSAPTEPQSLAGVKRQPWTQYCTYVMVGLFCFLHSEYTGVALALL